MKDKRQGIRQTRKSARRITVDFRQSREVALLLAEIDVIRFHVVSFLVGKTGDEWKADDELRALVNMACAKGWVEWSDGVIRKSELTAALKRAAGEG